MYDCKYTDVPVILISGKADMIDKVIGLEIGADDYIEKPLQMKEVAPLQIDEYVCKRGPHSRRQEKRSDPY